TCALPISGRVYAIFQGLVDSANLALSGVEPQFVLDAQPVEDESLKTIQYVTPSLLGWAIAMSATFGAATNLVTWRRTGLLRRLRLAPIGTPSVVLARVGVSLLVAFGQAAIFTGLARAACGQQLSGRWAPVVPVVLAGQAAV